MTILLEKAIKRLKELPDKEQDFLATFILERLEEAWDEQMKADLSENGNLRWMMVEALEEIEQGQTADGGFAIWNPNVPNLLDLDRLAWILQSNHKEMKNAS